jgi:hypothetical protein
LIDGLKNLVREGVTNLDPAPALFLGFVIVITHDADGIVVFAVTIDHHAAPFRETRHHPEPIEHITFLQIGSPF